MKPKNSLFAQIAKFGVVGIACFVIDYVLFLVLKKGFEFSGLSARCRIIFTCRPPFRFACPWRQITSCPCVSCLRAGRTCPEKKSF